MANSFKTIYAGGTVANLFTNLDIELTIDTYATGGVLVEFSDFVPQFVVGNPTIIDGTCSYIATFDLPTRKLKLWSALGTEASTLAGPIKIDISLKGVNKA